MIDAARNIEDVHADIKNHSVEAIHAAENEPIGELWKEPGRGNPIYPLLDSS